MKISDNPILAPSHSPFGAPQFDKIRESDYRPAFDEALAEAKAEIDAIADDPEPPTFANTLEAMEFAGRDLEKFSGIFFNMTEACTSPEMQRIAEDITPALSEYQMSVLLNPKLFQRVKEVYGQREALNLDQEQAKLLEETYKGFTRNGANLDDGGKARLFKIQEDLSMAGLKFGNNVLAATNAFFLNLTDPADLDGLPQYVKDMAAEEAKGRNQEGWTFTLQMPSMSGFMKNSRRRDLREKIWRAYGTRCIGGEFDNSENIRATVDLSAEMAHLLGYESYAEYELEDRMAKSRVNVDRFLSDMMEKSMPYGRRDVEEIRKYASEHGFEGELMPWDFSFWSERLKEEKYSYNEEDLKPYFELSAVQNALFMLANKLYGLTFTENDDIPVYHPDVKAFEVHDADGKFMALLYIDWFPRSNKQGGAWMTSFRETDVFDGVEERPFVSLVTNFTKPTADTPSLLTFGEVTTILHEFGHALHGMLAEGSYVSLTGTNVKRDFVECPSQLMENWAYEAEFLQSFARHYRTGEVIPKEYIDKIVASKNFLAGYGSVRQLNFGMIDMAWYTLDKAPEMSVADFETGVLGKYRLLPSVPGTAMSPAFTHIFSGGYSAGYYSYKWAEELEADIFTRFKEKGIFNSSLAADFRRKVLSKGGSVDADVLFRDFMGRDPEPEALMRSLGMTDDAAQK
jgi:peptidyl-dipeptidase Dcp